MTDKKDGEDGNKDEKRSVIVSFEEFLRKAEERDAAGSAGTHPEKPPEEMVVELCKLLGLVVNAHDALSKLYKLQSMFMIEHMDPSLLTEYLAMAEPLQALYAQKIALLTKKPPL